MLHSTIQEHLLLQGIPTTLNPINNQYYTSLSVTAKQQLQGANKQTTEFKFCERAKIMHMCNVLEKLSLDYILALEH